MNPLFCSVFPFGFEDEFLKTHWITVRGIQFFCVDTSRNRHALVGTKHMRMPQKDTAFCVFLNPKLSPKF